MQMICLISTRRINSMAFLCEPAAHTQLVLHHSWLWVMKEITVHILNRTWKALIWWMRNLKKKKLYVCSFPLKSHRLIIPPNFQSVHTVKWSLCDSYSVSTLAGLCDWQVWGWLCFMEAPRGSALVNYEWMSWGFYLPVSFSHLQRALSLSLSPPIYLNPISVKKAMYCCHDIDEASSFIVLSFIESMILNKVTVAVI